MKGRHLQPPLTPTHSPQAGRGGNCTFDVPSECEVSVNVRLYILQRATAALMVPLIVVHLVLIFYATRNGLSAAEILGRTRGSLAWGLTYGVFVAAAAVHGAIGLRNVAVE